MLKIVISTSLSSGLNTVQFKGDSVKVLEKVFGSKKLSKSKVLKNLSVEKDAIESIVGTEMLCVSYDSDLAQVASRKINSEDMSIQTKLKFESKKDLKVFLSFILESLVEILSEDIVEEIEDIPSKKDKKKKSKKSKKEKTSSREEIEEEEDEDLEGSTGGLDLGGEGDFDSRDNDSGGYPG